MKSFVLTAFIATFLGAFCSTASAQSPYLMILSKKNLDVFEDGTLLESPVPQETQSTIQEIQIGFDETKSNPHVELDVDVQVSGTQAIIIVDNQLLAKIKGQPVRFDVRSRPITKVVLKYDPPVSSPTLGQAGGEGVVFIRIGNSKRMAGKLDGFDTLNLKSAFGDVAIPMEKIAGVKFHTSADDKAVVILNNGDSVTGIPTLPAIQLMTSWGKADIDPEYVQSLTFSSGARFRQNRSDFGTRWILQTGNSFAPPALGN